LGQKVGEKVSPLLSLMVNKKKTHRKPGLWGAINLRGGDIGFGQGGGKGSEGPLVSGARWGVPRVVPTTPCPIPNEIGKQRRTGPLRGKETKGFGSLTKDDRDYALATKNRDHP